ncbi:MAG: prepilin-type N-terminal cleavage/methylation domain-containing protein [Psychroserpens sp.]|jgi:prepilin-type N-terminal cleavage/methylation domain-containing protein
MYRVNSNIFNNKSKGFTLIEVLVASFILFLVLTSITMVYRGAMLSSGKAERALLFSSFIAPVSESIRMQLQSSTLNKTNGQGSMGKITFNWTAIQTFQAQTPLSIDAENGLVNQSGKTFSLWDVTLQLQLNNTTREYTFSKVTW